MVEVTSNRKKYELEVIISRIQVRDKVKEPFFFFSFYENHGTITMYSNTRDIVKELCTQVREIVDELCTKDFKKEKNIKGYNKGTIY